MPLTAAEEAKLAADLAAMYAEPDVAPPADDVAADSIRLGTVEVTFKVKLPPPNKLVKVSQLHPTLWVDWLHLQCTRSLT